MSFQQSISPRKQKNENLSMNLQYLNFIRKNHMQLESNLSSGESQTIKPKQTKTIEQPQQQEQKYTKNDNNLKKFHQYNESLANIFKAKYIGKQPSKSVSKTKFNTIDIVRQNGDNDYTKVSGHIHSQNVSQQKILKATNSINLDSKDLSQPNNNIEALYTQNRTIAKKLMTMSQEKPTSTSNTLTENGAYNHHNNNTSATEHCPQFLSNIRIETPQYLKKNTPPSSKQKINHHHCHNQSDVKSQSQHMNERETIEALKNSLNGGNNIASSAYYKRNKQTINMREIWKEKTEKRNNALKKSTAINSEVRLPSIVSKELQSNEAQNQRQLSSNRNLKNTHQSSKKDNQFSQEEDASIQQCNIITKAKVKEQNTGRNLSNSNSKNGHHYQRYLNDEDMGKQQKLEYSNQITNNHLMKREHHSQKIKPVRHQPSNNNDDEKSLDLSKYLKRQSSIENYGSPIYEGVKLAQSVKNNNSVSIIKRRRNVPQKVTNFISISQSAVKYLSEHLSSSSLVQKSYNNKEDYSSIFNPKKINRDGTKEREKQFEKYLMDNSIIKSSKVFNYYEKQEEKKKILFNQLQMNYYQNSHKKQRTKGEADQESEQEGGDQAELSITNEQQKDRVLFDSQGGETDSTKLDVTFSLQNFQTTEELTESTKPINPSDLSTSARSYLLERQPPRNQYHLSSSVTTDISPKKQPQPPQYKKKEAELTIYETKIKSYKQFLMLVNFTHKIFHPIGLKSSNEFKNIVKFKYFIGKGNNRNLIKSLMKKRFWWEETDKVEKAHFVWTQLKVNSIFQSQRVADYFYSDDKFDKIVKQEEDYQEEGHTCGEGQGDIIGGDKKGSDSIEEKQEQTKTKVERPPKIMQSINSNSKKKPAKDAKSHSISPTKGGSFKPSFLKQAPQTKIFTQADKELHKQYRKNLSQQQYRNPQTIKQSIPDFESCYTDISQTSHLQKVHNHFQSNFYIGNKKALFYNLRTYYKLLGKNPFQTAIPFTLHIKKGMNDPAYQEFLKEYKNIQKNPSPSSLQNSTDLSLSSSKNLLPKNHTSKNIWIVKPGQLSNRGNGITVIDEVYELNAILKRKQKHQNGIQKSYILQKYIERPLLYKGRKFDIRHFMLFQRISGRIRAFWYSQGYLRTSSYEYKLDQLDIEIHLTNDAIQNQDTAYGKHQQGNKVSYNEFQRYLDSTFGQGKISFVENIYPQMKQIALDSVKSTYLQMDPKCLEHNFQLFGLDFMIDNMFKVWLIEVNTNPCLELSSKLLERVIPQVTEHTMRLCLDPIFPPPCHYPNSLKHLCPDQPLQRLQYELIFDEARDGQQIEELYKNVNYKDLLREMGEIDEEDVVFESDGKELDLSAKAVRDE